MEKKKIDLEKLVCALCNSDNVGFVISEAVKKALRSQGLEFNRWGELVEVNDGALAGLSKIVPKFKKGDVIRYVYGGGTELVVMSVVGGFYYVDSGDCIPITAQENYQLVRGHETEQDIKDMLTDFQKALFDRYKTLGDVADHHTDKEISEWVKRDSERFLAIILETS